MVNHISARLAWHQNGWNGHICQNPKENVYCVGQHSYPGDLISQSRDLEWEMSEGVAGESCKNLDDIPPCCFSINAFGKEKIMAKSNPPEWFEKSAKSKTFELPPATICIWPYGEMYGDDVKYSKNHSQTYNYDKRLENAKEYFSEITIEKSLIFYYANYSNPFSEDEKRKYVIVGISRVKSLGEIMYYDGLSQKTKDKYSGGFVWQKPVTSYYPDQGFCIPYHLYKNKPEILSEIKFIPGNERNFKYGSRKISNDDALNLVEKSIEIVNTLIDIGDNSQNWKKQKKWLQSLVGELWQNRGAYPGLTQVLDYLDFPEAITYFKKQVKLEKEVMAKNNIFSFIKNEGDVSLSISSIRKESIFRKWKLQKPNKRKLLEERLPRFELTKNQIEKIISDDREEYGIDANLEDIYKNPYIITEKYIGEDPDDQIVFNTIDHGIIPSPQISLENIFEKDSGQRLRALCVNELNKEQKHTFILEKRLLKKINEKLSFYEDWNYHKYTEMYFEVDKEILEQALVFRNKDEEKYIYLKEIFEDEKIIEKNIRSLINRPDLELKKPLDEKKWHGFLYNEESELAIEFPDVYEKNINEQIEVCKNIFPKPVSVITGAAGTGKTYLIDSIIKAIRYTEGVGISIRLLAPTGKAADRVREKIKETVKTSTIHSFLAERGWLNDNLTFKREGGHKETNISTFIIDEASMIDLNLAATIFRAINWDHVKRIIFIGDPNQLPPIGRGKFFAELIEWLQDYSDESIGELESNFRQLENILKNKGEGILKVASLYTTNNSTSEIEKDNILHELQQGEDCYKDLRIKYWQNTDQLEELLIDTIVSDIEEETEEKVNETEFYKLWNKVHDDNDNNWVKKASYQQIISPYRGELFGTENINKLLQGFINSHNIDRRGLVGGITLFDKVIQIKNRPKSNPYYAYNAKTRNSREKVNIYNGEIGFVKPHGFDRRRWKNVSFNLSRFQVVFSRKPDCWIPFNRKNVEENIELAYAISVHKSQGSEFERVYFVLPQCKKTLLTRELMYTALTRAEKHITIFAENDVSSFLSLLRKEKSSLMKINSSIFKFEPLPEDLINMSEWYEEGRIHKTLADYMVRSKSEVIIANILSEREIEFYYEKILKAKDGTFYLPDFTIIRHGKEWYWEHLGLLEKEKYRKHWQRKKNWYDKHFPGQLITTKESGDLSKKVEKIIEKKLL